jgi:hypothetical protein
VETVNVETITDMAKISPIELMTALALRLERFFDTRVNVLINGSPEEVVRGCRSSRHFLGLR